MRMDMMGHNLSVNPPLLSHWTYYRCYRLNKYCVHRAIQSTDIYILLATLFENKPVTMKQSKDEDKEESPVQPTTHNSSAGSNGHDAKSPVVTTAPAATCSVSVSDASGAGASVRTTGRVKVSETRIPAPHNSPSDLESVSCRNPNRCTIPRTTMCPGPAATATLSLQSRPPPMSSHRQSRRPPIRRTPQPVLFRSSSSSSYSKRLNFATSTRARSVAKANPSADLAIRATSSLARAACRNVNIPPITYYFPTSDPHYHWLRKSWHDHRETYTSIVGQCYLPSVVALSKMQTCTKNKTGFKNPAILSDFHGLVYTKL